MPILTPKERIGGLLGGRYRLERVLGEGAMGIVFAAHDQERGASVAVKLLAPELGDHPLITKRFFQEARAAASLRHPNVIGVYDLGLSEDRLPFLVLELLRGEAFSSYLKRERVLHPQHALAFTLPVMDALRQAHAQGIVHRDIKPANVYLDVSSAGAVRPVLLDFGVAKLSGGSDSLRTVTGTLLGSPGYIAPEQITEADKHGKSGTPPSVDVWAMGVLLYRAVRGRLPFQGPMPAIFARTVSADVPPPEGLPAPFTEALMGALKRDPRERYPSMEALIEGLLRGAQASGLRAADPRRS